MSISRGEVVVRVLIACLLVALVVLAGVVTWTVLVQHERRIHEIENTRFSDEDAAVVEARVTDRIRRNEELLQLHLNYSSPRLSRLPGPPALEGP